MQGLLLPPRNKVPKNHPGLGMTGRRQGPAVWGKRHSPRPTNGHPQATLRSSRTQVAKNDIGFDPARCQGSTIGRVGDGPGVIAVIEEPRNAPAARQVPESHQPIRMGRRDGLPIRGEREGEGQGIRNALH